jgi:hypothetical protein
MDLYQLALEPNTPVITAGVPSPFEPFEVLFGSDALEDDDELLSKEDLDADE